MPELIYKAKHTGEVFRVTKAGDSIREIPLMGRSLSEYVNSTQLYGETDKVQYQDYFEKDPFTSRQNEIIKVVEQHKSVQKEYNILKDMKLSTFLRSFIYSLIDPKYKNGKRKFPLMDFFNSCSEEREIRKCYDTLSTAAPLRNRVDFKLLGINKWDRVEWLKKQRIINI